MHHRDLSKLRVWLVHDWLTGMRGGEKVLLELVRMFPQSRIATLLHVPGSTHPEIDQRVVKTSLLQRLPRAETGYRNYLPLFPRAIHSLHLEADCDLVISVSHAVAKGIRVPRGVPHLCYCNTPMRYIWGMEDQYLSKNSPKRLALSLVKPMLRKFDRQTDNVTAFMANSKNVAERIQRFWNREAEVVYPGIDDAYFVPPPPGTKRDNFYLVLSALVPYKRVDLAVQACMAEERELVVIGGGPELEKLKAMSRTPRIQFLGRQPDEVVRDRYQRCAAFLFPGEEDFGLTPVEAMACGAPVIAYRAGGAMETVVDGVTGLLFDQQTEEGLGAAIQQFELRRSQFQTDALRARAMDFTMKKFREAVERVVQRTLDSQQGSLPPSSHGTGS